MLDTNSVSIDELRSNLADIINRVTYAKDKIVIKKHNRDVVMIISLDEYEKLLDPRKRLTSYKDWDKLFALTDKVRSRMSAKEQEELERIIDEEVKVVRGQKK